MSVFGWRWEKYIEQDMDPAEAAIRSLGRTALWAITYHEACLRAAHRDVAAITGISASCHLQLDLVDLMPPDDEEPEREYEEDVGPPDRDSYIRQLARSALGSIQFHEDALGDAHAELAALKALIARTDFDITIKELEDEEAAWNAAREREK